MKADGNRFVKSRQIPKNQIPKNNTPPNSKNKQKSINLQKKYKKCSNKCVPLRLKTFYHQIRFQTTNECQIQMAHDPFCCPHWAKNTISQLSSPKNTKTKKIHQLQIKKYRFYLHSLDQILSKFESNTYVSSFDNDLITFTATPSTNKNQNNAGTWGKKHQKKQAKFKKIFWGLELIVQTHLLGFEFEVAVATNMYFSF